MRDRSWVVAGMLLLLTVPGASAEILGSLTWDAHELVHLAGTRGDNLLADPRFRNLAGNWAVSFVDVGEGTATSEEGMLQLQVLNATASGAAYAEARVPVRPGQTYHLAFEARLLGNASEVAALVIPLGGGPELVVRGNPRTNTWGLSGEWTAPPEETQARILMRFMIEENESGGAAFSKPHFAAGPAPEVHIDGASTAAAAFLSPGTYDLTSSNATALLQVADNAPTIHLDGPRFIPVGQAPSFSTMVLDDSPELLPNPPFDRYRGWWSVVDEQGIGATLPLDRQDAVLALPATNTTANVSIAGVLSQPPAERWRLTIDAELPEGVQGHAFLRERDFPGAEQRDPPWHDAGMALSGSGPWTIHADRGHQNSPRLEVILAFTVAPGPAREVRLHDASLQPALQRPVPDIIRAPPQAFPGLSSVTAIAEDLHGQVGRTIFSYWVGPSPQHCASDGLAAAWKAPEGAGFQWRADSEVSFSAEGIVRVEAEERIELLREGEVWWSVSRGEPVDVLPVFSVARGQSMTVELPCAAGALEPQSGVVIEGMNGTFHLDVQAWRLPTRLMMADAEGNPVAELVVFEPTSTWVIGGISIAALMLLWGGRRWRLRPR